MRRNRPGLRVRVALTVTIGALLVAIGLGLLLRNTLQLRASANATIRGDAYLLRVVDLERLAVDAETGLRGDVITRRRLFLSPLRFADRELPNTVRLLRLSIARTGLYGSKSRHLITAVVAYIRQYVPHVLVLVAHDPAAARSFATTLEGKQKLDTIRSQAAILERELSTRDARRQERAHRIANQSVTDAIGALVLLTLLTGLTGGYLGHLADTRERARRASEDTARTLQESILPEAIAEIPGCDLAVRFLPGAGPVSGDFYDGFAVSTDTWALIIGDVCGKGAAAAAATAMARWTLRSSLEQGATPEQALRLLNSVMLGRQSDRRFITAVCMAIRVTPGSARVDLAAAGHPPPIHLRAGAAPRAVDAHGDLLGVFDTIRLSTSTFELEPGDALVAYTDGVTDQGPGPRETPERALATQAGADANALVATLERLAQSPPGPHPDDIAIIALRFLGTRQQLVVPSTADA